MAAINDIIKQITDPILRNRLEQEFLRLSKSRKFGLVFEEHIPECTPLYGVSVKVGSTVARKTGHINDVFIVTKIDNTEAICCNKTTGIAITLPISEIVAVAQFGEAIFPTLTPIDFVENAPDSKLWHTLIEADNYHALQLLEYLYPKQVDCIYIDPPYNTGATDWKYNNNYVDSNDNWRHSKWLSMMKKRLLIAKRILSNDGVLITTIDDNEFAHLWALLREIFPDFTHNCVTIQHNPGGTQGKKFSVTNEYAIYSYTSDSAIFRKQHTGGEVYNLRRWGSTSGRYEGATCFYPIVLDSSYNIIGFGQLLDKDKHPSKQVEFCQDGTILIWPIDINNIEKKWRYSRNTIESIQNRLFVEKRGDRVEIFIRRESEPPKTVWVDPLFNAEAHGTDLVKAIIGGGFPFPKSLYAVKEAISFAIAGKKNALVLDFFAGSGTTLQAVNLLNEEDNGHRRCILVTNNEALAEEEIELSKSGLQPGDPDWEKHGICRAVTWPRTKHSILGKCVDDSKIDGVYFSSKVVTKEKNRSFYQLNFADAELSLTQKKRIVSLIDNLPQTTVKSDSKFAFSKKLNHTSSILFNVSAIDEWLEILEDQDHITDFYIVTKDNKAFKNIKNRVIDLLGTITIMETQKRPMSLGFPANVEYFKLDFLDKNDVSLGRQFREILPLLWLKSNAIGKRPQLKSDRIPDYLIFPNNRFAILTDETKYSEFLEHLLRAGDMNTIYFVTNSEDAFIEMSAGINAKQTYQLYRDYIDNFVIGARRN